MSKDIDGLIGLLDEYENHAAPVAQDLCKRAAAALREQRDKIARLTNEISARSDLMQGYLDCWRNDKTRAERAEAERDALKCDLQKTCEHLGIDHLLDERTALQAELAAVKRDMDGYNETIKIARQQRDALIAEMKVLYQMSNTHMPHVLADRLRERTRSAIDAAIAKGKG